MTHLSLYIELLKAALVFSVTGVTLAIAGYWLRAQWWRNLIGAAIQAERVCLLAVLALFLISVFFHLNRQDSTVLAWVELAMMFVVGVTHFLLFYAFERVHHLKVRELYKHEAGHAPAGIRAWLRRAWLKFLLTVIR